MKIANPNGEFKVIVNSVLGRTNIAELLANSPAVVLERIARGAGMTRWYYCDGPKGLEKVEGRLSPGSVVSFYFDGRIRRSQMSGDVVAEIEKLIVSTGDAVVGLLYDDVEIEQELMVSGEDLAEYLSAVPATAKLFYGASPGRANDGVGAVTVTLPDEDGIVRPHPH